MTEDPRDIRLVVVLLTVAMFLVGIAGMCADTDQNDRIDALETAVAGGQK